MSYQAERDRFVARMAAEGLVDLHVTTALLRAATTLQRLAELSCSSEAADRDRVPCPAAFTDLKGRPRKVSGPCCCDGRGDEHEDVPWITVQADRLERRLTVLLETMDGLGLRGHAADMPSGWKIATQGDPRGYVLRVIPPSYAERNVGRDRCNLEAIGVPSGPTRIRW